MVNNKIVGVLVTLLLLGLVMAQMAGLFVPKLSQQLAPLTDSGGGQALNTVVNAQVPEVVELVGTIQTETEVTIAALVTARIEAISVRAGDRVAQGRLLIRL